MMGMQIDRAGPPDARRAGLSIEKASSSIFITGTSAGGLIFDTLDRRPGFAKIREQKRPRRRRAFR